MRGLDSPQRLLEFFKAKNHKRLVLRTADILQMLAEDQLLLTQLLVKLGRCPDEPGRPLRHRLQELGVNGYLLIPIDLLSSRLTLEDLQQLQAWLTEYQEVRHGRLEPSRTETCSYCGGKGCQRCGQTGQLMVLLEISDEEQRLAEGGEL